MRPARTMPITRPSTIRHLATFSCTATVVSFLIGGAIAQHAAPAKLAIADIDYLDTSGEPGDQTDAHAERVEIFEDVLGETLTSEGDYALVELSCDADACGTGTMRIEEIITAAREAGADYVLVGAIQKVSTLIGSGRVDLIDVVAEEVVADRVLSFRGDNDEAFRRAAEFAGESLLAAEMHAAGGSMAR